MDRPQDSAEPAAAEPAYEWEPSYGFCATNTTSTVELTRAHELIRRRRCSHGPDADRCDCKYGLADTPGIEHTGCPELRELIHRLLHRPETLAASTRAAAIKTAATVGADWAAALRQLAETGPGRWQAKHGRRDA